MQHSAIKKNEFQSVLVRWMKLEPVMEREGEVLTTGPPGRSHCRNSGHAKEVGRCGVGFLRGSQGHSMCEQVSTSGLLQTLPRAWHLRAPGRGGRLRSGEQAGGRSQTRSRILGARGSSLGTLGNSEINETSALQRVAGVRFEGKHG